MRISSRGQYGIRALSVLTTRHGGGPVQVREIARAEGLSAKYLEQLLGRLRSGGLVKSVRGARGGYVLARDPQAITVREVLVLLEGSLAPVSCVERGAHAEAEDRCGVHELWAGLHEAVLGYLGTYTLADLTSRASAIAPTSAGVPEPELETTAARG
jgi:Rrf2 family protein